MPPWPTIQALLVGILAAAQSQYPVVVSDFMVMSNHIHLLLRVGNPEDVPAFVGYVKRELSHAINRMLGRRQINVWEEGYDAPVIGSVHTFLRRLVYIYTNPQRAGLTDTIDEYPNLSTWAARLSGQSQVTLEGRKLARRDIARLPSRKMTKAQHQRYLADFMLQPARSVELRISPNAWMGCFPDSSAYTAEQFQICLTALVRAEERKLREARTTECIGREQLMLMPLDTNYLPQKRGRRMLILDNCKQRRAEFIAYHKERQTLARELRKINDGNRIKYFPFGFFLQGALCVASVLLWATPLN